MVVCIGATRPGTDRGVLELRRRRAELVEPRERGVEVCLVEKLAAVDQVAVDRQKYGGSPLGVEALSRVPYPV